MDDKELDRIFRESLESQRNFGGVNRQWDLLESELKFTNQRWFLWWVLILSFAVITGISYWYNLSSADFFDAESISLTAEDVKIDHTSIVAELEDEIESLKTANEIKTAANDSDKVPSYTIDVENETPNFDTQRMRESYIAPAGKVKSKLDDDRESEAGIGANYSEDGMVSKIGSRQNETSSYRGINDQIEIEADELLAVLENENGLEPKSAYFVESSVKELQNNSSPLTVKKNADIQHQKTNTNLLTILKPSLLSLRPLKNHSVGGIESNSFSNVIEHSIANKSKIPRLSFALGMRYMDSNHSTFSDVRKLGLQAGFSYQFRRWNTSIRINRRIIDRSFTSNFEKYDLLIDTLDYSAFSLTEVQQQATQWNGEIEIGYAIVSKKGLQIAIHQGIQSQWQNQEIRTSRLESAYQAREIIVPIDNTFQFGSFIFSGVSSKVSVTQRFGIAVDYHYMYSLFNPTIKWPAQHVVDVGIYYKFN